MAVPLIDLHRQYLAIKDKLDKAVINVLEHGQFILGPEVSRLEQKIASLSGVKYGVGVASGTDALLLSLRGANIGPGDEIITTDFSFFASAGVVSRLGATPVFVDIDKDTYNIDPTLLEKAITPKTKAIMPVHLFGQMADMDPIMALAKKHNLIIIEDAAQAIGAAYKGKKAGSIGDYGCFSFFPSKNLGGFGDGGLVATNDERLAARVRRLRAHGAEPKYFHAEVGGNFRLDALQAALLRVKLHGIDAAIERRKAHARAYTDALASREVGAVEGGSGCGPGCSAPVVDAPILLPAACGDHTFNQYVVRFVAPGARDRARGLLTARGIGTSIYYPRPLHLQACFAKLGHGPGDFPVAEQLAQQSLAIPIFPEMTEAERARVVDALVDAVG